MLDRRSTRLLSLSFLFLLILGWILISRPWGAEEVRAIEFPSLAVDGASEDRDPFSPRDLLGADEAELRLSRRSDEGLRATGYWIRVEDSSGQRVAGIPVGVRGADTRSRAEPPHGISV